VNRAPAMVYCEAIELPPHAFTNSRTAGSS
jgi:hypothetical protein